MSRLLSAVLWLACGPAAAAGPERSLSPVVSAVRAAPALQQTLGGYIGLAASLSAQPSPSLAPLEAAASNAQDARLIGALIADPQAVAAHDAELRPALGDFNMDVLLKTAVRLQERARGDGPLAEQLGRLKKGLDLGDAAAMESLAAAFDAARAASPSAPAVYAGDGAGKKPLVSLTKPAMSPAQLEAYVLTRRVTSPRGLSRVNFESGVYRPEYDAALRLLGVDVVVVKAPSRAELAKYKEEDGYHLKSEYVRWVGPALTREEFAAALKNGRHAKTLRKALEASAGLRVEIGALTVEKFEQWYQIYEDEVVGKPGGKRNVVKGWARQLEKDGLLGERHGLFYYAADGRMIGGILMRAWKEKGMFVANFAAYRDELKNVSPAQRSYVEAMEYAKKLGFTVFSQGEDTDFYGFDYNIGLMASKAGQYMTPYPSDEIVLMKVLDTAKIASVKTKEGKNAGYLFFGINRSSALVERYLRSKESEPKPQEAQDLLGGLFFSPQILPASEVTTLWHFKGDDTNPTPMPEGGVRYEERRMK